jgi:hypothetical protein
MRLSLAHALFQLCVEHAIGVVSDAWPRNALTQFMPIILQKTCLERIKLNSAVPNAENHASQWCRGCKPETVDDVTWSCFEDQQEKGTDSTTKPHLKQVFQPKLPLNRPGLVQTR